jgi:hypothetical protein
MIDDEPLTAAELYDQLADLETELRSARTRADDRDVQYQVMLSIGFFADMKWPTGLGVETDRALIPSKAAAMLLVKTLKRARKHVPTLPQDLDQLIDHINRLLGIIPAARKHLQWRIGIQEGSA